MIRRRKKRQAPPPPKSIIYEDRISSCQKNNSRIEDSLSICSWSSSPSKDSSVTTTSSSSLPRRKAPPPPKEKSSSDKVQSFEGRFLNQFRPVSDFPIPSAFIDCIPNVGSFNIFDAMTSNLNVTSAPVYHGQASSNANQSMCDNHSEAGTVLNSTEQFDTSPCSSNSIMEESIMCSTRINLQLSLTKTTPPPIPLRSSSMMSLNSTSYKAKFASHLRSAPGPPSKSPRNDSCLKINSRKSIDYDRPAPSPPAGFQVT